MKKIVATAILTGTLTACATVPDTIEYNGQEAYDVVAVYTSSFDFPPTDAQTAAALVELQEGDGFARLPARAAKACPSGGYRILKEENAEVGSYLISATPQVVARWTQRFIVACT